MFQCLVFDPDREIVQNFLSDLGANVNEGTGTCHKTFAITSSYYNTYYEKRKEEKEVYFEHIVLECCLSNVTKKFQRHLDIIKPALDVLLHQIALDPATYNLRRLLAFRKSLSAFEQNVAQCLKMVKSLLTNDEDLVGLHLTRPKRLLTVSYFTHVW